MRLDEANETLQNKIMAIDGPDAMLLQIGGGDTPWAKFRLAKGRTTYVVRPERLLAAFLESRAACNYSAAADEIAKKTGRPCMVDRNYGAQLDLQQARAVQEAFAEWSGSPTGGGRIPPSMLGPKMAAFFDPIGIPVEARRFRIAADGRYGTFFDTGRRRGRSEIWARAADPAMWAGAALAEGRLDESKGGYDSAAAALTEIEYPEEA